tara:strand:+ start:10 stop:1920 length:1911 start_codon:yes stop_codon:yes gene_type:complete
MSLLITEQRDGNISDKPFSYRNNISNGFIVEPDSEIALINSTINRGGSFNISKDRKLFVFWGNPLPTSKPYYKDDQGRKTDDVIPYEKQLPTKDIPWEIIIPRGVYTTSEFTKVVEDSLNKQCPHPAFGNLETRFGASVDLHGHFTCELKLNAVNEFKGFKISIASETYDHNNATRYPTDQVEILARDGSGGGYDAGGDLTSPAGSKLSIMYHFKQPIHPSEGSFKITIPNSTMNNNWIIGLVRNNNKGEYMPYDKNGAPNYNYGAITDQFGNDYNDDIFNDYGGDFFDYALVGNGTDIRLWYLDYDEGNDMYQMDELEYWDTATYKGTSGFQSVAKTATYNNANTDIDFYIQNENIIIEIANTKITDKQLPAVGSSTYSLYPKAILGGFDSYGVNVRPCSRIIGWDSKKDLSYKWWYDPLQHELLRRSDYWRTQYVEHIIFDMVEESDEIPAGVWIDDFRTSITKTNAQVHNINFNSTQRIVLISGDMTGIRYNVNGNIQGFLGFEREEDEPDTETPTLIKYQTKMDRLPEVNSNNTVHVRINDLEMRTLNGTTASFSRIVGSVPRHLGSGNISSGLIYHEPQNLIFLDLHNKEKMIINSIQVDMVNSNETFAADLQDYTSNTFLIRKKNKNIIN